MPKVVLITGASSGIGKAIAEKLATNSYIVYGTSRNPIKEIINGVRFLTLNLNNSNSIKMAVKKIISKEGKIDILINNAGVGITGPIEETPTDAIRDHFQTNFFGVIEVIQAVLPHMHLQDKGSIINITSIAGYMGLPFRGYYSASKSALITMTEALRLELKLTPIKVFSIAPGDIATNIGSGRYTVQPEKKSVYFETYQNSLSLMNAHVDQGEHPKLIANKVLQLLEINNPKVHYNIGSFLQKFSVFLKGILPDKVFEKMLAKHYKL